MDTSELKKKILSGVRSDDIVAAMLFQLPAKFRADKEAIHTTFADLSKEYPDLFSWFEVTSDYPYPFSRCLEDTLHRLGQDRILSILNPSFALYSVDDQSKQSIRTRIWDTKFDDKQRGILTKAAERLEEATKYEQ